MKRVGLFGGSFNPVHVGHLVIAEQALSQANLDLVLWMPAFRPPHKADARMPSAFDRLAMCRLATVGQPGFEVSDLEIQREGVSFTVDTVRKLEELHPDWDLHMILGSDSLAALDTWKDPAGLLEKVTLIVYPRHGDEKTAERLEATQARGFLLDAPLLAISASDVRGRLARGQSVRYLIPDRVLSYVEDHALYR